MTPGKRLLKDAVSARAASDRAAHKGLSIAAVHRMTAASPQGTLGSRETLGLLGITAQSLHATPNPAASRPRFGGAVNYFGRPPWALYPTPPGPSGGRIMPGVAGFGGPTLPPPPPGKVTPVGTGTGVILITPSMWDPLSLNAAALSTAIMEAAAEAGIRLKPRQVEEVSQYWVDWLTENQDVYYTGIQIWWGQTEDMVAGGEAAEFLVSVIVGYAPEFEEKPDPPETTSSGDGTTAGSSSLDDDYETPFTVPYEQPRGSDPDAELTEKEDEEDDTEEDEDPPPEEDDGDLEDEIEEALNEQICSWCPCTASHPCVSIFQAAELFYDANYFDSAISEVFYTYRSWVSYNYY